MAIGPLFYAVKVITRDDGVTLYLADHVKPESPGRYARERLDKATIFPDRERAVILLETFPELHAEVVCLRAVVGEPGNWRGWHVTGDGGRQSGVYHLHGPEGGHLTFCEGYRANTPDRPWTVTRPDGRMLRDVHDRPRTFGKSLVARRALHEAIRVEFGDAA